jgi:hypothetical protein
VKVGGIFSNPMIQQSMKPGARPPGASGVIVNAGVKKDFNSMGRQMSGHEAYNSGGA